MKRHEQPKVGMWLRQHNYQIRFGKIVYRSGNAWVVKWHSIEHGGWNGIHDWLQVHNTNVVRKCRIISARDAKAEIVMHQLAR